MKRVFILLSNLFISSFLIWIAFISPNTVIHRSLPVVGVLRQEKSVTYEELSSSLDRLARENHSKKLVAEYNLEKSVSHYDYAVDVYQQMAQFIQIENLMIIAGGVFGIATSVLLFNTMNFLYFEEFRKQIFLKKIAGLGFVNIHQTILLSESVLLLLGSFLVFILTSEWWIALVTLFLFLTNAWFILLYRSHKEDHLLATVLKGA